MSKTDGIYYKNKWHNSNSETKNAITYVVFHLKYQSCSNFSTKERSQYQEQYILN